jgi:hypothetical protein
MSTAGGVQTIVRLLETITSDGELKAVALEVQRRCNRLQAERLALSAKATMSLGLAAEGRRTASWNGWNEARCW